MFLLNKRWNLTGFLILGTLFFYGPVSAQKYKTVSDTTRLNKEYGKISLDLSKLNTKLIAEKNKTVDYQSKTISTEKDAVSSGQNSKDQAATATSGNTTDTKKAVRDAKRADREANDAKNAAKDEKKNNQRIKDLTAQIAKKQKALDELDSQKAAIMAQVKGIQPLRDSLPH